MYCSLLWEWWQRWRCGSNILLLLLSHNLFMLLHEIGETLLPPYYHIGKNGTPNLRLVVAVFLSWVTCAKNCHPPFTIIILCFFFLLKSSKVEKKNNQILLLKKEKKEVHAPFLSHENIIPFHRPIVPPKLFFFHQKVDS